MNRAQGFYESSEGNYTPHGLIGAPGPIYGAHSPTPDELTDIFTETEGTPMSHHPAPSMSVPPDLIGVMRKHGFAAWDRAPKPVNLQDLDIPALVRFIDLRLDELSEEADTEANNMNADDREHLEPWVGLYWNLASAMTSIVTQAESWADGEIGEVNRWTILTIARIWSDHDDFPAQLRAVSLNQPTLMENDDHEL